MVRRRLLSYWTAQDLNMVLADLGRKLNAALSSLSRAPVVDEKVTSVVISCGLADQLTAGSAGTRCDTQRSLCCAVGVGR